MQVEAPTIEKIADIVAKVVGPTRRKMEAQFITADTQLIEIGADEIDLIGIEMALHDAFGVTICEGDMNRAESVSDFLGLVLERMEEMGNG